MMRSLSLPQKEPVASGTEPVLLWARPTNALARVRNVLVFRDESMPTPADAQAIGAHVLALHREYPEDGVFVMHVTPPIDHGYPNEATRAAFIELVRSTKAQLRGVVYAYLREDVLGHTVRSVARAMLHASRAGRDSAVVNTVEAAAAWAAERSHATEEELATLWHTLGSLCQEPSGPFARR